MSAPGNPDINETHTFEVFKVALQNLLGLLGVREVLREEERTALESGASPHRPPGCPATHRFALLLQVLEVLGELHAHAGHHVLSDELPLAGVVVHLVEDLLERAVVAESAAEDGRVGKKHRRDSTLCWVALRDAAIPASGIGVLVLIQISGSTLV